MAEHLQNPTPDKTPRIIRRNGSFYTRVFGSEALTAEERLDTIIRNIASELDTPAQVEVLETVIRPALEKYGTE